MFFYHHKGIKVSTLVIDPSQVCIDNIDITRAKDKYWSKWRFEQLFQDVDDWRIMQLLSESAVNNLLAYNTEAVDISSFYIHLEDFLENEFDDTHYFEIPMSLWYILKDRKKLFAGKNIIISQPAECFFVGLKCDQLYYPSLIRQDPSVLTDLEFCKTATVVWDNIDSRNKERFPHINWIPVNLWLPEYAHAQSRLEPNPIVFRKNIRGTVLKQKKHDFVALLGKMKLHREDFAKQVVQNNLHLNNEIGTNFDEAIKDIADLKLIYEEANNPHHTTDRDMRPEWYRECRVWISLETAFDDPSILEDELRFCQLTEKTFKPMAYGMPFLLNGGYGIFEYIESLGFKTFTDVFGNYVGETYQETNSNIIDIIRNLDTFDWNLIADHCEHNHDVLMSWTKTRTLNLFMDNLEKAVK